MPVNLRYTDWWYDDFPEQLSPYFDQIVILGKMPNKVNKTSGALFSPVNQNILYEQEQIRQYLNLELLENDILLLNDLSFPGMFANVLFHKRTKKCFTICHGTSKNAYDYFNHVRKSKWKTESAHANLFNKVFVATKYHQKKLGWKNIIKIGLPNPNLYKLGVDFKRHEKIYDIISVCRPGIQKVNKQLEYEVEKRFGKIIRKNCSSWNEYYNFVSQAKVIIITAKEETYGFCCVDAVVSGSVPLAPNKYSYPELLPSKYLYNDIDELIIKINKVLEGTLITPILRTQQTSFNFYDTLASEMLED